MVWRWEAHTPTGWKHRSAVMRFGASPCSRAGEMVQAPGYTTHSLCQDPLAGVKSRANGLCPGLQPVKHGAAWGMQAALQAPVVAPAGQHPIFAALSVTRNCTI